MVLGVILLAAVFLRFWLLDTAPPGWRDDELINSLVISQHVLDGDLAVYYADASGHEALYHVLNAIMLGTFGPGVAGIRWLSAILGVASVFLTFLVGRRLYGPISGLVASATLAVSFWSLMYSRTGIRHILLPVLVLAAYLFFIRGLGIGDKLSRPVGQLSQGERQRVAVCRALLAEPALILADEPTGNLDPANKEHVLDILGDYVKKTGATMVAVTHDHEILPRFDSVVDFSQFHRQSEGVS